MDRSIYKFWLMTLFAGLISVPSVLAADVEATNCELFIDKVAAFQGGQRAKGMTIFVKTLNDRLDGPIAEVCFRNHQEFPVQWGRNPDWRNWHNEPLHAYHLASDYFFYRTDSLASEYGGVQYEGVFYVRTQRGTVYWIHSPTENGNFVFDAQGHDNVLLVRGWSDNTGEDAMNAVSTQQSSMRYYNPMGCR
jgi:hypothetical protein